MVDRGNMFSPANNEPSGAKPKQAVGPDNRGGFSAPAYLQPADRGQPISQAGDAGQASQPPTATQGGEQFRPANGDTPFPTSPAPSAPLTSMPGVGVQLAPANTPVAQQPFSPYDNTPSVPMPETPYPGVPTQAPPASGPMPAPIPPLPQNTAPAIPALPSDSTPYVPSVPPVIAPPETPPAQQPYSPVDNTPGGVPLNDLPTGDTPPGTAPAAPFDYNKLGDIIGKLLENPSVYDDATFKNAIDNQKADLQTQLDSDSASTEADFAARGLYLGSNLPVATDALRTKRDRAMSDFTSNMARERATTMANDRQQAFGNVFNFLKAANDQGQLDLDWAKVAEIMGMSGAPSDNLGLPGSAGAGGIDPAVWAMIAGLLFK